jgi:hypothetical protein
VNLAALLVAGALVMPQPWGSLLFRRDHVIVLGAPGCGKTPYAASLCADARRAVFFDSADELDDEGEPVPGDLVRDLVEHDGADAAARELLAGTFRRVVVKPTEAGFLEEFEATAAMCRAAGPRAARLGEGLVFLVDEVGDLTDGGAADTLRGLHRNGHKDGVCTIFASPCWTDIPARCRSTRSRVYSFAQLAADDVATMNRELGRVVPNFGDLAARWQYPAPPVAWISPTLHE